MNVQAMRETALKLSANSRKLEEVIGAGDRMMPGSRQAWRGRDSEDFAALWNGTHRPNARQIADDLERLATIARKNISAQLGASQADAEWARVSGPGREGGTQLGNPRSHDASMLRLSEFAYSDNDADVPTGWEVVERFDYPSGLQAVLFVTHTVTWCSRFAEAPVPA